MRVKAGEYEKIIPQEYAGAVQLLTLADWENPEKKRLTPLERFRFAEAAWRVQQTVYIQDYIGDRKPEQVVINENRKGEIRYTVMYKGIGSYDAIAIVPAWVFRACPKDLVARDYQDWMP